MTKPIIALDFNRLDETLSFLKKFDEPLFVKVGMELYLLNGTKVIEDIKAMGHDIFLDLKLYDIPNTVGRVMEGLGNLDVAMTNVHAQGGSAMMKRAVESFKGSNPDGTLIAVTQLTSMSERMVRDEQKSLLGINDSVLHYAELSKECGLDGVVSSPLESGTIHDTLGQDFLTVTPGIRLAEDTVDDQVRVVSPGDARKLGADYIVVGRSITGADDPVGKYRIIKTMWEGDDL